MERVVGLLGVLALLCVPLRAQTFYTYVGELGPDVVLLAWGTATGEGQNTIGRGAKASGTATIKLGDQTFTSPLNWIRITGLQPDTEYPYEVTLQGRRVGSGSVRTWPLKSERLTFFVIGDWGSGTRLQYDVVGAMVKEMESRRASGSPVRFVITTGDNIYREGLPFTFRRTGDEDWHWEKKFFAPYRQVISSVPFYASLGNHDGNESESRSDLPVYLDNFFFPTNSPARYYRFSYGGWVDFFALDSTLNSEQGSVKPAFSEGGPQHDWLRKNLAESEVPWKIPYFHHPVFSAGPRHPPVLGELKHFVDLFERHGVKVVFNGHEHNYQFSEVSRETRGIRFVVSGAGGELRPGNVRGSMQRASIAGWAAQAHFCVVEIDGRTMRITPVSYQPVTAQDRTGKPIDASITVELR